LVDLKNRQKVLRTAEVDFADWAGPWVALPAALMLITARLRALSAHGCGGSPGIVPGRSYAGGVSGIGVPQPSPGMPNSLA
jgi:hypothetical protein